MNFYKDVVASDQKNIIDKSICLHLNSYYDLQFFQNYILWWSLFKDIKFEDESLILIAIQLRLNKDRSIKTIMVNR